jgi:hypothetical protein
MSIKEKKINDRLLDILYTYPGSLRGNIETRGLDSKFAINTYIKTELEVEILQKIKNKDLKLEYIPAQLVSYLEQANSNLTTLSHLQMQWTGGKPS